MTDRDCAADWRRRWEHDAAWRREWEEAAAEVGRFNCEELPKILAKGAAVK